MVVEILDPVKVRETIFKFPVDAELLMCPSTLMNIVISLFRMPDMGYETVIQSMTGVHIFGRKVVLEEDMHPGEIHAVIVQGLYEA